MRTTRLLVPLAVLALVAGCTGDEGAQTGPTPDRVQVEERREKVAADDGADDGDSTSGADGDLATCILGEWTSEPADLAATSDAMMSALGMSSSTVVTGETFTTIDEETISTTYVDQVTEMTLQAEGQTIVSIVRMNGTMAQAYTLEGDVMISLAGDISTVEIESTVLVDGAEQSGYSEGFQLGLESGATAGQTGRQQLACTGDLLEMETLGMASLGMADMIVTLSRR